MELIYFYGFGLSSNHKKAAQYFKQAADMRHLNAAYTLGCLFFYGFGVEKNSEESVKYFELAAKNGHKF